MREWYVLRHSLGFGAGYGVDVEGVGRGLWGGRTGWV